MFIAVDKLRYIGAISGSPIAIQNYQTYEIPDQPQKEWSSLIGKRYFTNKPKLALICNWADTCGIASYSYNIYKVLNDFFEIRVFGEDHPRKILNIPHNNVFYCWKRGEKLDGLVSALVDWQPDTALIQHDYGLFPDTIHFLRLLEGLGQIPYTVTVHSLQPNRLACFAGIKQIVVHSKESQELLYASDWHGKCVVIPHGCSVQPPKGTGERILPPGKNIIQFGFCFSYKGIENGLRAVSLLKDKYPDIFYTVLMSEREDVMSMHKEYYAELTDLRNQLDIKKNVLFVRGYQSEAILVTYIEDSLLAIFPYNKNPHTYAASGAIRFVMTCDKPVIASDAHLFDDLEGIIPRPAGAAQLAEEIDKVLSNSTEHDQLLNSCRQFILQNSWQNIAEEYRKILCS